MTRSYSGGYDPISLLNTHGGRNWLLRLLAVLVPVCLPVLAASAGPWDISNLRLPPRVEWIQRTGSMRSLYFDNELYQGHRTKVFAYFALPEQSSGPLPAIVLVHGGGGTAFPEWATMWAQRGYAAIAMDLAGNGPDGVRLADAGPNETDQVIFYQTGTAVRDAWVYHAVAAVIRAVSFLQQQPEVDPHRIGITGISWGGFLTAIAAGIDDRLKVAMPVYGCGYLYRNSVWKPIFDSYPAELRQKWIENFDPSRYLGQANIPMLWVTSTNDFAFPLDSYQHSYRLPTGQRWLRIVPKMSHGHREGWEPIELCAMADYVLKGTNSLPQIQGEELIDNHFNLKFSSSQKVIRAELIYTVDQSQWRDREWKVVSLAIEHDRVSGELPTNRPITYFVNLTDTKGQIVSSEHHEILPSTSPHN